MPASGYVINKFGSAGVVRLASTSATVCFPFLALAPNLTTFALALLCFGATTGALDVAMNAHGLAVEQSLKKPIMSSFHGSVSLASLAAASVAVLLVDHIGEFQRFLFTGAICLALILVANSRLLPAEVDRDRSQYIQGGCHPQW